MASKPLIAHPGLGRQGLGQMPVAFTTDGCHVPPASFGQPLAGLPLP